MAGEEIDIRQWYMMTRRLMSRRQRIVMRRRRKGETFGSIGTRMGITASGARNHEAAAFRAIWRMFGRLGYTTGRESSFKWWWLANADGDTP